MVGRFFFTNQINLENCWNDKMMLLSGPSSCGKTSLLFQYAFNVASQNLGEIVFVCNKQRLEYKPPYLSHGIDPSSDVFERIQMKYIEDYEDIKKYFAAFHLYEAPPAAVVIDDFGDFFDDRKCQHMYNSARGRDLAMVRTLALCQDALAQVKWVCRLLLSDTNHGDNPRSLFVYKRWIHCIFMVKGEEGSNSFQLRCSASPRYSIAKYSIALQYLVLEDLNEENM